jgi:hypothetical protein
MNFAEFKKSPARGVFAGLGPRMGRAGSTRNASEIGDRRWRQLSDSHDYLTDRLVGKHRDRRRHLDQ